ncbi:MAG: hypothetical protein ACSHWW_07685 [Nonlabens sp.]|uniref:hypothetical protein n=1 Tax=Nonlabens sp. TaxID=1888209 RepID=UPI003EF648F1
MFKNRSEYIGIVEQINNSVIDIFDSFFGINIEFILKIQLSYQLHLAYAKGSFPNFNDYRPLYLNKYGSVSSYFYILKSLFILSLKIFYFKFFVKFSKKHIVFVGNTTHNTLLNDECQNLYLSAFTEKYSPKDRLLLYLDAKNNNEFSDFYLDLFIEWYKILYSLKYSFSKKSLKFFKKYGDSINSHLQSHVGKSFKGIDVFLADQVVEYLVHKNAYRQLLLKLKPSIVQGYCFYENRINAMISAANSLNIKTIEYQHSAISNSHFAYSKWERVDELYLHFPSYFYVWNKSDLLLINDNFVGVCHKPQGKIVGIKHLAPLPTLGEKKRNKLLICLQGIWMPQWLEDFIIKDDNHQWFIRLHPRYPNDKTQLNKLDKLNKKNLYIHEANTSVLEELLKQSIGLITCFSGTALEAYNLGIEVLIYGEEGKSAFNKFIEDGQFTYVFNERILENKLNLLKPLITT